MEEKTLVKSEHYSLKYFGYAMIALTVILLITCFVSFDYYFCSYWGHQFELYALLSPLLLWGIAILLFQGFSLTITDKRIFGKIRWWKRVDLPVDSVTAVSKGIFKSVGASTASGNISFLLVKNQDEVFETLKSLIVERQSKNSTNQHKQDEFSATNISSADELKKFKELLDAGIITQEEFDAKKKQLLGL